MSARHGNALPYSGHQPVRSAGRHSTRWTVMAFLCLAGCAAEIEPPALKQGSEEPEVGVTQEAVVNGWIANGVNDFSGIVRLWATNTKFNEVRQFCSGVLLRNDVVLTARHCLINSQAALDWGCEPPTSARKVE